ncbi:MAG: arsenate reductase ArsC [Planctomycetota bacterium]|nr:arsenate reductase ArsC [Planctomycetota bacterium]
MSNYRSRVLFVCVENSCRSQMAEALARLLFADRIEAHSAGSRPSGNVHPKAVLSMRSMGYDLTRHRSKPLDELPEVEWDWAITMGRGDECPDVRARQRADWQLPDPKQLPLEEFEQVRDLIRARIEDLAHSVLA